MPTPAWMPFSEVKLSGAPKRTCREPLASQSRSGQDDQAEARLRPGLPDRRQALPRGTAVAARPHEGEAPRRCLAQGGRSQHGTAQVVRPRSGEVGHVRHALRPRARLAAGGLAADRVGSPTRDRHTRLQFARRGTQQCRRLATVLASEGAETGDAQAECRGESTAAVPSMTRVMRHSVLPLQFSVQPIPPFRLDLTVWALRRRARNLVDRWDGTTYRRVVVTNGSPTELSVRQTGAPTAPRLVVTVTPRPRTDADRRRLRRLLDRLLGLRIDLTHWYQIAAGDARLRPLADEFR